MALTQQAVPMPTLVFSDFSLNPVARGLLNNSKALQRITQSKPVGIIEQTSNWHPYQYQKQTHLILSEVYDCRTSPLSL